MFRLRAPIVVWFDGAYYRIPGIIITGNDTTGCTLLCRFPLLLRCLMMYYIVYVVVLVLVWCPCMAINVIAQYNVGFLPDMILLS